MRPSGVDKLRRHLIADELTLLWVPDGRTVNGSAEIIAGTRSQAR